MSRRHFTIEKLEAAQRELIELYLQLDLPKAWSDGRTVAADGTQCDFYGENLLAGYHFRYRKMGAVAYRHVANNYVAVFCHFIPPGVWEAVYVIEGLMKGSQLRSLATISWTFEPRNCTIPSWLTVRMSACVRSTPC